ncbi:HD-GYP domain-containing protein [Sporomusa sp.]|uniref:HD-GYP domain-containing protein n=1 Tax=Sporomusa sp. TaxID=2078658 RepID=UPI002CC1FC75|nr:HD-GYP domain-containing protein [Sporomusa sp.]HWR45657.1 HD-GYP domain-containing protein [Sporomusa sp.]
MHNPKQVKLSIINKVNMEAIEEFCRQVYYCDPYTSMHAEHVAELMAGLANQMCMSSDEINLAFIVGLIHDVGKIKTPGDILTKPARLTDDEFEIMKQHAEHGADMLAIIEGAEAVVPIMRHHHERHDGKGYPRGLSGEDIPLLSRMLAICDTFDAMTTNRCYRKPVTLEECIEEIKRCSGTQFNPVICKLFIEFLKDRFGFMIDGN